MQFPLTSCLGQIFRPTERSELPQLERSAQHTLITAIALGTIALLMFAIGCFLWGASASPSVLMTGFNFFPSLAGSFICFVGLGVFCATTIFAVRHAHQRSEMLKLAQRT